MWSLLGAVFILGQQATSQETPFDADKAYRDALNWRPDWQPRSKAWVDYMDRRLAQIARISDTQQKWDGFLVAMQQGIFVQNYTERGWAVVDCPEEVYRPLYDAFHEAWDSGQRNYEGVVDQVHCEDEATGDTNSACRGGRQSWFVNTGLNRQVLDGLLPLHEEWAQASLLPSIAYGLRVYQNGSSLTMHTDRIETHVVSSILHVDRDYGERNEPWPIVIEGIDGVTAELDLLPGQLLLYESAKCTHGRPRTFRGKWYTSLFIHYRPSDYAPLPKDRRVEMVPASWRTTLPADPDIPELTVYGTGFKEHACPHGWCALSSTPSLAHRAENPSQESGIVNEL